MLIASGNHDVTLDSDFYAQYGSYFHNQELQNSSKCQQLLEQSGSILYLRHQAAVIKLEAPGGPRTSFKVFGSPYSPAKGMWAFGYGPEEATTIWDKIPLDADVVITHTPPKYHCDESKDRRAAGCEVLRHMLWRIRPRMVVCGHVHEGRGAELIKWDLDISNVKYKELGVERWTDPGQGNKKLSLLDLTTKGRPIQNDGSIGDMLDFESESENNGFPQFESTTIAPSTVSKGSQPTMTSGIQRVTANLLALPKDALPPASIGQGGIPPSRRCDLEALSGRLGRRETCVVNSAIMASSWPHKGSGGKTFNKPIVVDIDLPIWDQTRSDKR